MKNITVTAFVLATIFVFSAFANADDYDDQAKAEDQAEAARQAADKPEGEDQFKCPAGHVEMSTTFSVQEDGEDVQRFALFCQSEKTVERVKPSSAETGGGHRVVNKATHVVRNIANADGPVWVWDNEPMSNTYNKIVSKSVYSNGVQEEPNKK